MTRRDNELARLTAERRVAGRHGTLAAFGWAAYTAGSLVIAGIVAVFGQSMVLARVPVWVDMLLGLVWIMGIAALVITAYVLLGRAADRTRRMRLLARGRCPACRYDLSGTDPDGVCPECGS